MKIGRMIAPVGSLGPGKRVCLWTRGCSKNCPDCMSPDLQTHGGTDIEETALAKLLCDAAHRGGCSGLTISGGDPFEQPEALLRLLTKVRSEFDDILVYTGYVFQEISSGSLGTEALACLDYIDVLIDGPYIKKLNIPDLALRGSSNQNIIYLSPGADKNYHSYLAQGRLLECISHGDTIMVTGIPDIKE